MASAASLFGASSLLLSVALKPPSSPRDCASKNLYINVSDQNMDYSPKFCLYMTSRLPNPHFSPELSAKCTVIDFTVTLKGLEQQLLGRVIGMEMRSLEETKEPALA